MKKFAIFVATLLAAVNLPGQAPPAASKPAFNEELAHELGADEYGMRKYVVAFLKAGPTKVSGEDGENLQKAHLKNIVRLADDGKLIVAGPFLDKGETRGIFIFNVETVEEAKKLTESDPAVQRGTLQFELRPWYGSAALMQTFRIHKTIEKKSVAD